MTQLLLASRSPRRRQLLEDVGFTVRVATSDIEESSVKSSPVEVALDLARQKGDAAVKAWPEHVASAALTLASDTLVWTEDGNIHGKPRDRQDARKTLRQLMGAPHYVTTAYALYTPKGELVVCREVSATVEMISLSDSALEAYLDTEEPWDKAGAYGVQGLAGAFISRIEGSWHTVVGLPVYDVLQQAQLHGLLAQMPWENSR